MRWGGEDGLRQTKNSLTSPHDPEDAVRLPSALQMIPSLLLEMGWSGWPAKEGRKRQRIMRMSPLLGPLGLLVLIAVCLWCRAPDPEYPSFGCYTITPNPVTPSITRTLRIPIIHPILNFVSCFFFSASHCIGCLGTQSSVNQ